MARCAACARVRAAGASESMKSSAMTDGDGGGGGGGASATCSDRVLQAARAMAATRATARAWRCMVELLRWTWRLNGRGRGVGLGSGGICGDWCLRRAPYPHPGPPPEGEGAERALPPGRGQAEALTRGRTRRKLRPPPGEGWGGAPKARKTNSRAPIQPPRTVDNPPMPADTRPRAIALMGPTASGKTALALDWAQAFGGEIVSVDSALVYRGLDIGSAKPDAAERARAPHHLLDLRDPWQAYSAADFARDARTAIDGIVARGRLPILAGGTGLYCRALLRGLSPMPEADPPV